MSCERRGSKPTLLRGPPGQKDDDKKKLEDEEKIEPWRKKRRKQAHGALAVGKDFQGFDLPIRIQHINTGEQASSFKLKERITSG